MTVKDPNRAIVVWQDVTGLPKHLMELQGGGLDVIPVSPRPHRFMHTHTFTPKPEWINPGLSHWFKADAVALSAAYLLGLEADFYWFVESDVQADARTWKALFDKTKDSRIDCLHTKRNVGRENSLFRHWNHFGTPKDANSHFIMAVYRLSRKALEVSIEQAEKMRDTFSEVSVPYVMEQNGLSMADINQFGRFYTKTTMGTEPNRIFPQPGLLNHPVKI